MEFEKYLRLPINKRKEIIESTDLKTAPFWQERLVYALKNSSPLACSFNRDLVAEYWTLKRES